jgi:pyruvate dehydrogenase E1 component beta subunit
MRADERVHLLGYAFMGLHPSRDLLEPIFAEWPQRVWWPPIAELGLAGIATGAAMAGLRPIMPINTGSFIFQAWPQIANEAANAYYMSGGQVPVPAVYHLLHGLRGGGAAQHSHSPQAMLWNTPGLEIVLPASPADAKGLWASAVVSQNPTVIVDHVKLFDVVGPVPDGAHAIPFGQADVKRQGGDVTVIATSWMVQQALKAAELVAGEGISVEVVDPRTLVPLDEATLLSSVEKTRRVVIADECHRRCGVSAELAAVVAEHAGHLLKSRLRRVATDDVPVPASPLLEQQIEPTPEKIAAAIRDVAR